MSVPQVSTIVAIISRPPIEKKIHKRRSAVDIYFGENCWIATIICRSRERERYYLRSVRKQHHDAHLFDGMHGKKRFFGGMGRGTLI